MEFTVERRKLATNTQADRTARSLYSLEGRRKRRPGITVENLLCLDSAVWKEFSEEWTSELRPGRPKG